MTVYHCNFLIQTQDLLDYQWTLCAPLSSVTFCGTGPIPLSGEVTTSPTIMVDMYHNIPHAITADKIGEGVRTLIKEKLCTGNTDVE